MSGSQSCPHCGDKIFGKITGGLCPRCLFDLAVNLPEDSGLIGQQVSHYRVTDEVGKGGMGVVYRAVDTRLGRTVALKFLPSGIDLNPAAVTRFEREARSASALNHPNICTIHDVGQFEGRPFIVMELLEGETLSVAIKRGGLPASQVLEIAVQVAEGLDAAHSKGLIHRDIKPSNIFITSDRTVKILDFGLAKKHPAQETSVATRADTLSDGTFLGTLLYTSPEQAFNRPLDLRTDLFSLGVVLYETLTGKRAFDRESPAATVNAILNEEVALTGRSEDPLIKRFQPILNRLLAKEPEKRYSAASELKEDLLKLGESEVPKTARLPIKVRQRLSWSSRAFLTLLLTVFVVAIFLYWDPSGSESGPGRVDGLAVLPFANLTQDERQDYLADAMTDALISSLVQIEGLSVPSRTTVMRCRDSGKSLREISDELDVDALMEGSVQLAGETILFRIRLIYAEDEKVIYTTEFRRRFSDIVSLQNEIARAVAREIELELAPEDERRLAKTREVNPEGYEQYLRGLYLLNKRESLQKAVEYFESAIAVEPGNPLAHSYLAYTLILLSSYGSLAPAQVVPRARIAAQEALKYDESVAEAHSALGLLAFTYDRDWALAEWHFKTALNLDPRCTTAHHWYGLFMAAQRDLEGALESVSKAKQLEPHSPVISSALGRIHYYRREFGLARSHYDEALELEPKFTPARLARALVFLQQQRYPDAVVDLQDGLAISEYAFFLTKALDLFSRGRRKDAFREVELLIEKSRRGDSAYLSPFYVAVFYILSGEVERGFEWLHKANLDRSEYVLYLDVDPIYDGIRSEAQYESLRKALNLPD